MTLLDDFQTFVKDAEAGTQYAKWAHDNPGELERWQTFRDAILAGSRPTVPPMLTPHGRELIDAGIQYLDATTPAPAPAPSPTPAPAPTPTPAPTPAGWVAALPGSTGQQTKMLNHPVGAAVNLHSASDPMTVSDTIVVGGTDQAFLVQPLAPGRSFVRCQGIDVNADGKSVTGDHLHAVYAKAAGVSVMDFNATGSSQSSNGLSCRFGGFLGQRVVLSGFPEPLGVFADDETPGSIIWRQMRIDGGENAWVDVDEASKMVYEIVLGGIEWTHAPSKLVAFNSSTFQGKIVIEAGCTLDGVPVAESGGVDEFVHAYPTRLDASNETRRATLPDGAVVFV